MANRFNFDKVLAKWQATDISLGVANVAKNDFLNNFREQGFNGNKWEERKKTRIQVERYL